MNCGGTTLSVVGVGNRALTHTPYTESLIKLEHQRKIIACMVLSKFDDTNTIKSETDSCYYLRSKIGREINDIGSDRL